VLHNDYVPGRRILVSEKYDVIIVGAGYAGLASAVTLLEEDYKVL